MKNLYIIGAGGYAKSVLDSLNLSDFTFKGFIDDYKSGTHLGYPIVADNLDAIYTGNNTYFFIAIGDNIKREKWYSIIKSHNYKLITVIDQSSIVSKNATLGEGCFVGKMAIVNAKAIVGDNCIINTKALVEHGVKISNHVNVSTNTVLNGDVNVGEGAFIGSSSVVNGQLTIGNWATVGSGAVVTKNVNEKTVVAGVPARELVR